MCEVEEDERTEGMGDEARGRLTGQTVTHREHGQERGDADEVRDEAPREEPAQSDWCDHEGSQGAGPDVAGHPRRADRERDHGDRHEQLHGPPCRHEIRQTPACHVEELVGLAEVSDVQTGGDAFHSETDLQGHWEAAFILKETPVTFPVHLALDIAKLPDGTFSATVASIYHLGNNDPRPTSDFRYTAPHLHMEWKWMSDRFEGDLKNGKLAGIWYAGAAQFPLVFERRKD